MKKRDDIGAIVLAAGKGKRMNAKDVNKVAMHIADKPMIVHTVDLINSLDIKNIVVVVGFARSSVETLLHDRAIFAHQTKRLGTAHAVFVALKKLPAEVKDVLILNGDDSAFYKQTVIDSLIEKHKLSGSSLTFLTIEQENPSGLGRVVRNESSKVTAIVEDKDATDMQKQITEINPGCYLFNVDFLRKFISKVKKSPVTGEYYLTSLIDIGIKNNQTIETLRGGKIHWRGVNTKDELTEAEKLFLKLK